MTRLNETTWCDGCGVEILWAPLVEANRDYCCAACRRSWACLCGERQELEEGRRAESPDTVLAAEAASHEPGA